MQDRTLVLSYHFKMLEDVKITSKNHPIKKALIMEQPHMMQMDLNNLWKSLKLQSSDRKCYCSRTDRWLIVGQQ